MSQTDPTLSAVGSPDEAPTILAPGVHVVGRISGQEDVRVHGTVEGQVHLAATLFVEPEGIVAADVHAHDIVVAGTVVGNLSATGSIVLAASARVVGDLQAPRLVVAPGAAFRGQVSMDPPEDDELEDAAAGGRGHWQQASNAYKNASGRSAARQAPAPARTASGIRLPPMRQGGSNHSARRRDDDATVIVKHPAIRGRLEEQVSETYAEPEEGDWGDGVKRAKKVARPRVLARGKHKVERL